MLKFYHANTPKFNDIRKKAIKFLIISGRRRRATDVMIKNGCQAKVFVVVVGKWEV